MKNLNKVPIALLASLAIGCSTTGGCPFNRSGDDCDQITVTAYLPPVVAELNYKNIQGSRNQVIVQGGFQHALSVPGPETLQPVTEPVQSFALPPVPNAVPDTETVLFAFDHAALDPVEMDKLDHLLHRIENAHLMHIRIEGHTDSKGSARYNQKLSIKRAKTVKNYLIQHGIQASKISIEGLGESDPVVPNDTEAHRIKNRRADLIPFVGN
jgi:outer membrane protein OmpA-like peptidoglycan-associated protein